MYYPKVKKEKLCTCMYQVSLGEEEFTCLESEIVCLHALLQPSHSVIETAHRADLTEEEMIKVLSETRWLESYLLSASCFKSLRQFWSAPRTTIMGRCTIFQGAVGWYTVLQMGLQNELGMSPKCCNMRIEMSNWKLLHVQLITPEMLAMP